MAIQQNDTILDVIKISEIRLKLASFSTWQSYDSYDRNIIF